MFQAGEKVTADFVYRNAKEATLTLHALLSVPIVDRALLRIAQHGVGLCDLLEVLLCILGAVVAIRMMLESQLPVRFLDRLAVGCPINAEEVVVVRHLFGRCAQVARTRVTIVDV